jgi:hypothetical protein
MIRKLCCITWKGGCLLSTKSEVNELLASYSVSYALICKDALISLHDLQQSLPPIVASLPNHAPYMTNPEETKEI